MGLFFGEGRRREEAAHFAARDEWITSVGEAVDFLSGYAEALYYDLDDDAREGERAPKPWPERWPEASRVDTSDRAARLDEALREKAVDRTFRRLSREHPTAEVRRSAHELCRHLEVMTMPDPDARRRADVAQITAGEARELIFLLHAPPPRRWRSRSRWGWR